jgi:hypothetical protein
MRDVSRFRHACAPEQEEVLAAQGASAGLEEPAKGSLQAVTKTHGAVFDRFAAGAGWGEKPG